MASLQGLVECHLDYGKQQCSYFFNPLLPACRLEPKNVHLHWQQANLYSEIKESKKALETYEYVLTVGGGVASPTCLLFCSCLNIPYNNVYSNAGVDSYTYVIRTLCIISLLALSKSVIIVISMSPLIACWVEMICGITEELN